VKNELVPQPIPMSSREVAADFVERLKAIIDEDKIRMYPFSFDANLYVISGSRSAAAGVMW
jgi:hypothetical protein